MAINIKGLAGASKETNLDGIGAGTAHAPSASPEAPQGHEPSGAASAPPETASPPSAAPMAAPGHQSGASFLMTGNQQQSQVNQIKAVQDLRAKLRTNVREFWLEPGQFARLYFLDGKLLADNVFDTPMIAVHMLQIGGQWEKVVCTEHTEGKCIICGSNAEGSQPTTMQLFTVINVMPYTIQNGPRRGTVLPARLQLFAATVKTREKLVGRAKNRGGYLAGSLYQFSRGSKQDARTGDDIEYIQDVPMQGVLAKYPMLGSAKDAKGDWKDAPTTVYDYAKVYPVLTNAEIAALRPDIASMAGFSAYTPVAQTAGPATGFGGDPTAGIQDEIPF